MIKIHDKYEINTKNTLTQISGDHGNALQKAEDVEERSPQTA